MPEDNNRRNDGSSVSNIPQENRITSGLMQNDIYTPDEATNTLGVGVFQVKLIILSSFVWMARGFETILLRAIPELQTCTWNLKRWQGALFTTITLFSTILGCFFYGIWSDNYGRRMALSSSLIFLFVFGAVSGGLPSYTWFVIFRAVAGFAVGGLSQALVLCCELIPGRQRGRSIYILSCFWSLSVVIMLSLLYYTVDTAGSWRIFIAVGTLPAFLAMVMMRFYPESFRFLLVSNHYIAANEIVAEMMESNQKQLPGYLEILPKQKHRGRVSDLFDYTFSRSTLLFCFMGMATSISFMGLNFLTSFVVRRGANDLSPVNVTLSLNFMGNLSSPIHCLRGMSADQFLFIVWTNALDFPGFIIYMILVDILDRKKLLCASYLLSTLFTFLLFIKSASTTMYAGFVHVARTLLMGQFDLLLLTTAETFPTTHRGTAVGLLAASFYLGHFLNPYIVECLLSLRLMYPVILYGVLAFCCSIASICLKHETRGKELADIVKK